jgi:glucose-1-phosphate thymidylyltransferase
MKGLILAGGTGTRLWPITRGISKQLLPVYDKPLIYYPLSTLMLAGIREISIITTLLDQQAFKTLLGNGSQWGLKLNYTVQDQPNGIAEAFILASDFIQDSKVALILGDNIFHGSEVGRNLKNYSEIVGAHVFAQKVANPEEFGVIELDSKGKAISITEKPKEPKSNYAVTGLYFYDESVSRIAKTMTKSKRGELEISTLNQEYLERDLLGVTVLPRGTVWLDGGTVESLHDAGEYVRVVEQRQGMKIGCVEEIAWRNEWISDEILVELAKPQLPSGYGEYLMKIVEQER